MGTEIMDFIEETLNKKRLEGQRHIFHEVYKLKQQGVLNSNGEKKLLIVCLERLDKRLSKLLDKIIEALRAEGYIWEKR